MMSPLDLSGSDLPLGDMTAILRLRKWGAEELVGEMWALFRADAPRHIAAARRAMDQADWPAVAAAAHSIRGSSAQLGSPRMSDLCATIESHALAPNPVPLLPLLDALERELATFATWLNDITSRPGSPDHA